jgi:hypothetical protein
MDKWITGDYTTGLRHEAGALVFGQLFSQSVELEAGISEYLAWPLLLVKA